MPGEESRDPQSRAPEGFCYTSGPLLAACSWEEDAVPQAERAFAGYHQEKKLRRSEQLNGSQICFSAAFPHSAFMYLA